MNRFQNTLARLENKNQRRSLNLADGLDFTSNDYLGMRNHPALREKAIAALNSEIPIGSGGSRLLRGHCEHHAALEDYAAAHFGHEKSLYFATGYQANMAIFQALPNRHDTIIFDALIHASAREAIQNSPARSIKIPHNNLGAFERSLKKIQNERGKDSMIWIAVESLYSMDGDYALLPNLQNLALKYNAMLIIDEAHTSGITPLPFTERTNVVSLHTCGKAIGVAGGLVCASSEIIDVMVNTARAFIYSTAPMPLQAVLTLESLKILNSAEGDERRARLQTNIDLMGANSHIYPVILGDNDRAINAGKLLQYNGFDIRAIRPPTVPKNTARLRISLSSEHNETDLEKLKTLLSNL